MELDALFHLAGWQARTAPDFRSVVDAATAGPGWVACGNYSVVRESLWARADTVVWLDLPRRRVMTQVIGRTLRRVITREELWNGNREPWSNLFSLKPERSIISWAWTRHRVYAERYAKAMTDPRWSELTFVRLRSRAEIEAWLAALP